MSLEPGAVGITSTTSAPTSSTRHATSRQAQSRSALVHPARLGRSRPGRVGRVEHVHVDAQEDRAGADDVRAPADDLLDPELAARRA